MRSKFNKKQFLLFAIIFAAVGGLLVWRILAATPNVSYEVENATVSGNAIKCPDSGATADSSASNGHYVMLNSSSCNGTTPPPPPPTGSCLQRTGTTVKTVSQLGWKSTTAAADIFQGTLPDNTVVNLGTSTLTYGYINGGIGDAQVYGMRIEDTKGGCWTGGRYYGTVKDSSIPNGDWERWHDLNGIRLGGVQNWTFENTFIRNYGDLVNIAYSKNNNSKSQNVNFNDSLFQHSHDDCIQNDYWASVNIKNMFFDGCFSGISTRSSGDPAYDASSNVVKMEDSLMWLEPEKPNYGMKSQSTDGTDYGHSGFFKWENASGRTAKAPQLYLKNVTFMARKKSNSQSVGTDAAKDKITHCENVTIIWAGSGDYPERSSWDGIGCTGLNIITGAAAQSAWLTKVNAWFSAHPQFADLKHPDNYYWTDHQPD